MSLGMAQLWWRRICIMLVNNFIERGKATSALRLLCRLEEVGAEEEVCYYNAHSLNDCNALEQ